MSITETVALVTGAASGIGLATARRFAEAGARVILTDIQAEKGESEAAQLRSAGTDARFLHCDVADPDSIKQLFEVIASEYDRLDYAFNNAGIEGSMGRVEDSDPADWHRILSVNLTSVYECMRHEIPLIRAAGGGAIINCSSVAGLVGIAGGAMYCATKHGVIGMTRATALDLARERIRVNAVCPGMIDTPMVERATAGAPELKDSMATLQPLGRLGTPDEIANAVIWLCQPESELVTGVALPLDGGWTAQ